MYQLSYHFEVFIPAYGFWKVKEHSVSVYLYQSLQSSAKSRFLHVEGEFISGV